jgi:hypothetical protein
MIFCFEWKPNEKNAELLGEKNMTRKWVVDGFLFCICGCDYLFVVVLMALKKHVVLHCVNYVRVADEPCSYCKVLDGLWQWRFWWDALVASSKEWTHH